MLFNSAGSGTLQGGPGTKISFTAAPNVFLTALATDMPANLVAPPLTITGSELVTDGNLATDPTLSGWTFSAQNTWSPGQISGTMADIFTDDMTIHVPVTLAANQWYRVEVVATITGDAVTSYPHDHATLHGGGAGPVSPSGSQTYDWTMYSTAAAATEFIVDMNYYLTNGATWVITSVSLKAIAALAPELAVFNYEGLTVLSTLSAEALGPVSFGRGALPFGSQGDVGIGDNALAMGGGPRDIAIGFSAMRLSPPTSNGYSIAIGFDVLMRNQGQFNISIGTESSYSNETGAHNVVVGTNALYNGLSASYNVIHGDDAGGNLVDGDHNVLIGNAAGFNSLVHGSGNILIGDGVEAANDSGNYLNLGGVITGNMSTGPMTISVPWIFEAIQKAGLPTTSDITAGQAAVFKDTSGGGVYLAYNDAGTIKKVALT